MDLIGKTIDRYEIRERLGQGGMAIVYRAYDTRLERDVAIKIIRRKALPEEQLERLLQRFEREAKAQAKFNHPNIVPIFDYGEYDGSPYLVMSLLTSGTLKERTGGPMPMQEAARLLTPIASALAYAHARNVLHRDVKPSNILIDEHGTPFLADFGIAKLLGAEEGFTLTGTGIGIGTPEYMAPEQWKGESGPQTDVYALGVVLYELVTGRRPYAATTPHAVGIKQATEPLPPPRDSAPDLSPADEGIILKALALNPEDRHASMAQFANLLAGKQEPQSVEELTALEVTQPEMGATISDSPPVAVEGLTRGQTGALSEKQPAPRGKTTGPPKIPPWAWAAGGVALVILAALTLRGGLTPAPTETPTATPTASSTPPPTPQPTATATPGVGSSIVNPVDGARLLFIPAGNFTMGSEDGDSDERPVHTVHLDDFWMYETEVTNIQFAQFVADTGHVTDAEDRDYDFIWTSPTGSNSNLDDLDLHPVVNVSWNDAVAYCGWAGMHLPTEAEWEKAARGDDGRTYPWGNTLDLSLANSNDSGDGFERTAPVGSFPAGASPYGLLDMAGNVWEWVADYYASDFYSNSPTNNPHDSASGDYRVLRGGSWNYDPDYLRSANRSASIPAVSFDFSASGFRCASSEEGTAEREPVAAATNTSVQPAAGFASTNPVDGARLLFISAGEFTMGSGDGYLDEQPVHTVYLDDYWMYETEVTNAQFAAFVAETGYTTDAEGQGTQFIWTQPAGSGGNLDGIDLHPVVNVSWNDAVVYCGWAGMRLPTEAEWEKAARGDDGRTYPWGDPFDSSLANSSGSADGFERTAPVGSFPGGASPYGLLDMAGNVWEWVADYYASDFYTNSPASNPTGPQSEDYLVLRGGSWGDSSNVLRAAFRDFLVLTYSRDDIGFRCASSPGP